MNNTMIINEVKSIRKMKQISTLSLNLIRDDKYMKYFDENGYDELFIRDDTGISPIEYMFFNSNVETITYVLNNPIINVLTENNIELVLKIAMHRQKLDEHNMLSDLSEFEVLSIIMKKLADIDELCMSLNDNTVYIICQISTLL
jgi:hypothetical protein